jgi:hypothetical protein
MAPSLPYNAALDDLNDEDSLEFKEDAAWERQRGTKEYEVWKQKVLKALQVDALESTDGADLGTASAAGSSDRAKFMAKSGRKLKSLGGR